VIRATPTPLENTRKTEPSNAPRRATVQLRISTSNYVHKRTRPHGLLRTPGRAPTETYFLYVAGRGRGRKPRLGPLWRLPACLVVDDAAVF
jgi:hypothetical protein